MGRFRGVPQDSPVSSQRQLRSSGERTSGGHTSGLAFQFSTSSGLACRDPPSGLASPSRSQLGTRCQQQGSTQDLPADNQAGCRADQKGRQRFPRKERSAGYMPGRLGTGGAEIRRIDAKVRAPARGVGLGGRLWWRHIDCTIVWCKIPQNQPVLGVFAVWPSALRAT